MVEAILYVLICVLTGLCGRHTRIGFAGTFIVAIVLTPLLVLPALLLTATYSRIERTRHRAWRI
jgi:hypothetical protein